MKITPEKTRIGWIGTGVMGNAMCAHLIKAGYAASIYTRTRAKAADLEEMGAEFLPTAGAVARASDVVITMVGFPADVDAVYFGEEGILAGTGAGMILVDMTTTTPSLAVQIGRAGREKGAAFVDAPVSGGDVGARNATLSIMAGGDADTVDSLRPIWELLGGKMVRQGECGAGQHAKMCNQIVIAGTMIGVCESLLYGYRAGLDPDTLLSSIAGGAAGCWSLDNLAPRIIRGEFDTGFFVEHFVKDMGIALEEAGRMNISLPGLALVHQLYRAVLAGGGGRLGTQSLIQALARLNHTPHLLHPSPKNPQSAHPDPPPPPPPDPRRAAPHRPVWCAGTAPCGNPHP